jgi:hypothetical protein
VTFLCLANIDLKSHMTSEGEELQRGLAANGWILCGTGYGDGCKDVKVLLERHRPRAVFVAQKSDWDPKSAGSFRKDLGFLNLGMLKDRKDIFKICPVKDASGPEYQRQFCEEIAADLVVHYYHEKSIGALCPWLKDYRTLRIYHSIDARLAQLHFIPTEQRKRGIVSGAVSGVYPLREMVFRSAQSLGLMKYSHPGYSNHGCQSGEYLKTLGGVKIHICTASRFHFSLRKIFESVAVGAVPITNLPTYDNIPCIDGALVRVPDSISVPELHEVINQAERGWDYDERLKFAQACWQFYDWRIAGERLNEGILKAMEKSWTTTNS